MSETETETQTKEAPARSLITKAADRGEEAVKRISAEIDKNERTREVRDRVVDAGQRLLRGLNLAPRDEVDLLRKQVELLEQRLAEIEGTAKPLSRAPAKGEPGEQTGSGG